MARIVCLIILICITGIDSRALAHEPFMPADVDRIAALMDSSDFEITGSKKVGAKEADNWRFDIEFTSGEKTQVKWKSADRRGVFFNNEPQKEVAAFRLQKMYLESRDYVVPPSSIRVIPIREYSQNTIKSVTKNGHFKTDDVLGAISLWLKNVNLTVRFDKKLFSSDREYARAFSHMNLTAMLIDHGDGNMGNFMGSDLSGIPGFFLVDNGIAFGNKSADKSPWNVLKVKELPADTVNRLRKITMDDLEKKLHVVSEFEILNNRILKNQGTLKVPVRKARGFSNEKGILSWGLTSSQIRSVFKSIERLIKRVDKGKIQTF